MSASATANAPPTGSREACVPGAERSLPRPGAVCASPAERGTGRPDAPDTLKPGQREPRMAVAAPRAAAAWRARGRGSAGASGWRPACARAADASPSRGAPSANPAGKRDALKSESSTPPGERKGFADGAVRKSSTRLRRALRAPQKKKNAGRARTPRAGNAIATGGHAGVASTAAPMRTQG